MPLPILGLAEKVRHVAGRFPSVRSKPQEKYLVTVLLELRECAGKRTVSGIVRVAQPPSGSRKRWLSVGWNRSAPRCSRWWKPNEHSSAKFNRGAEVVAMVAA